MKTTMNPDHITDAYLKAYRRVIQALKAVENKAHDLPAPEGEIAIDWGHVGDMHRIASELEEILQ